MRALSIVFFCFLGAPAQATDPPRTAQVRAGETAYIDYCESCHGPKAAGGNSPNIQGVTLPDIRAALQGIEEMPAFDLEPAMIDALARYLMSLAPGEARRRLGQ